MPNRFLQYLYKEYIKFLNDADSQKVAAVEEVAETLQGES